MKGAPIPSVAKSMKSKGVIMRDLAGPEVQALSDAEWRKATLQGVGKMKAVTTLSAAEVDNVLAYMRSIKKK